MHLGLSEGDQAELNEAFAIVYKRPDKVIEKQENKDKLLVDVEVDNPELIPDFADRKLTEYLGEVLLSAKIKKAGLSQDTLKQEAAEFMEKINLS